MREIGLFPLGLVLVPSERIPLHIFEPRYRELIRECVANDDVFGIMLEDEDGRRDIGTLAAIADVVHTFDDGRMNILVEGRERFAVTAWTEGRAYPTAEVELLEDVTDDPADPADADRALELFRKLAEVTSAEVDEPDGASGSLAFEIAAHVDFGMTPKQDLLELDSERDRLHRLASLLDAALAAMTRERDIKERASTNGRVTSG